MPEEMMGKAAGKMAGARCMFGGLATGQGGASVGAGQMYAFRTTRRLLRGRLLAVGLCEPRRSFGRGSACVWNPRTAAETATRKVTGSRTARSRSVAWGGITAGRVARSVAAAEDQTRS